MARLSFAQSLLPSAQSTKKLIQEFAERSGMVYFGYVSQRSDDHHIVRGLTVSTKHIDDHYCIGTYEEYDVVFVERSDQLHSGKRHSWHIVEFDLKAKVDVPHIFIGSLTKGHGFHELLHMKYPTMQPVSVGATAAYPAVFSEKFGMYVTPTHALQAESIVTPAVAEVLASHFAGLVVEIVGQSLYIYSERSAPTTELFDTMLKNGAWLATTIDENSQR